ncbi:MAG TPA: serine hydrolase [Trebonia sp.]|jgi:beta-lactamase class A|nr:serine hydrolase [Trebonia sp.]
MAQDWNGRGPGGMSRAAMLTALRTAGVVVALVVAGGILYLSFRGHPSSHPVAATLSPGITPGVGGTAASGGRGTGSGASVPASPSASGSPAASKRPTATASATTSSTASPLGPAVGSYLSGRTGTVRVAVYDLKAGKEWSIGGADSAQSEASIVKVNILEALLSQRPAGLTSYDQSLAQRMIEDSDNDSATTLWNLVGGASGIGTYNSKAGLTQTTPSTCVQCPNFAWPGWGLTTTSPEDQVTLLRRLVETGGPLTSAQRQYILSLMENVASDQRWGASGGVPAGVTVALKNGWLPLDPAQQNWQINSMGWVSGDNRDYLVAMLSTGNPTEQYGIDTLNSVSSMVWSALG